MYLGYVKIKYNKNIVYDILLRYNKIVTDWIKNISRMYFNSFSKDKLRMLC